MYGHRIDNRQPEFLVKFGKRIQLLHLEHKCANGIRLGLPCGLYVALKPAYSQRYIQLKSLGKNYSEESIRLRIIAARNGIRDLDKPKSDYNAWLNKYEPTKLHGFKALYFHYLYLFGKIRKKETPQRISFYMREELIKFERYQKQFRFLYDNDIETVEQLTMFKENAENKIDELTIRRSKLYDKTDSTAEIKTINAELRELRKDVRTCNNIFEDAERIREHTEYVARLEKSKGTSKAANCKK